MLNRIKAQIDFSTARGHLSADLIFTTMNHYNRGGSTKMNASQLLGEAFKFYEPTESPDITLFIDAETRAKAFVDRFDIKSAENIKRAAEKNEVTLDIELLVPRKKYFNLDADNRYIQELWGLLEGIRYRDRAAYLNKILFHYFAHGLSEYYNALCAERILAWLKEELYLAEDLGMGRFNKISQTIWTNAGNSNPVIDIDSTFYDGEDMGDRLRKAMGLL